MSFKRILHLFFVGLLDFFVIFVENFFGQQILEFGEDDSVLAVALAGDGVVFHFSFRVDLVVLMGEKRLCEKLYTVVKIQ